MSIITDALAEQVLAGDVDYLRTGPDVVPDRSSRYGAERYLAHDARPVFGLVHEDGRSMTIAECERYTDAWLAVTDIDGTVPAKVGTDLLSWEAMLAFGVREHRIDGVTVDGSPLVLFEDEAETVRENMGASVQGRSDWDNATGTRKVSHAWRGTTARDLSRKVSRTDGKSDRSRNATVIDHEDGTRTVRLPLAVEECQPAPEGKAGTVRAAYIIRWDPRQGRWARVDRGEARKAARRERNHATHRNPVIVVTSADAIAQRVARAMATGDKVTVTDGRQRVTMTPRDPDPRGVPTFAVTFAVMDKDGKPTRRTTRTMRDGDAPAIANLLARRAASLA